MLQKLSLNRGTSHSQILYRPPETSQWMPSKMGYSYYKVRMKYSACNINFFKMIPLYFNDFLVFPNQSISYNNGCAYSFRRKTINFSSFQMVNCIVPFMGIKCICVCYK